MTGRSDPIIAHVSCKPASRWTTYLRPSRQLLSRAVLLLMLFIGLVQVMPVRAQSLPPPESPEAYLVTYGPGEIYWQRFGHNAVWLREPGGLDHTFNYGFFDFEQDSFLRRFVQGRMLYFAAAVEAEQEFAQYASEGREIRVQRLDLDRQAYARLREHLLWNVQPENKEYLYDYYQDNCSTRVRDALDLALQGVLADQFKTQPAGQNYRSHTRRSTQSDRDYYLGLVAGLGMPVDRSISRWEEQFLPAALAESMAVARLATGEPLVIEDRVLLPGLVAEPPPLPGRTWPFYLAVSLGLLVVAGFVARRGYSRGLARAWLLVSGTLGFALLAIWALTDHVMAYPNLNLLLFQPLAVLGVFSRCRRLVAMLILLTTTGAFVVASLSEIQYLADTVALAGPLNIALVVWLLRRVPNRQPPGTGIVDRAAY